MTNIQIKNIEIYHGSIVQDNSIYLEHFKSIGKDVEHFLADIMGRKNRYLLDSKSKNSLTMAIEAVKKVLNSSHLTGKDIDMIIFSSILPEYVAPPSSFIIHHAIDGKEDCFCQDMNVNCIGMTYALDLASKYMTNNDNMNRALIVGADFLNPQTDPNNEMCYGEYGDAACALILEKTSRDCGVIETKISTQTVATKEIRFPKCGFSNIYDTPKEDIFAKWDNYQIHWYESTINNMSSLLKNNNLTVNDISMFCFSQFSYNNIEKIRDSLKISKGNSLYIGDTYGYTGTSSPFIVLYEAIKAGSVKRGDYVMFWTIATGTSHIALLFKY